MELTEVEKIEKYSKKCGHCNRKKLLPYEYEFTCFFCGYNVIEQKQELTKIQRKKMNFIKRLKYAEHRKFCICVNVQKIYEDKDYDNLYEILCTSKKS